VNPQHSSSSQFGLKPPNTVRGLAPPSPLPDPTQGRTPLRTRTLPTACNIAKSCKEMCVISEWTHNQNMPSDHGCAFRVWTEFTASTGKRCELPRGMPLVTRVFASSEHAWDPMASSSVNFCRKTRTVRGSCLALPPCPPACNFA
jgi:hypothetical protein